MSTSLYGKWRPQTFEDLKGQDVIRDTLSFALANGRMSHAYLFCGPRGTGKTTTARLIAKTVNCVTEDKVKPCNTCHACLSITDGANFDVLEIDAASNRGIDEIRQLRDSVRFAPTQAKFKVFIIDEVHMLTREAFNALLKTLEEPPAHALFILATTEAHKIPPTVISRCQRYDFRLATQETLTDHLLTVASKEGMKLSRDAAQFLARLGQGSFRDSLSLLDQVKAHDKSEYTQEVIEEIFGYVPEEQVISCLQSVFSGDIQAAHTHLDAALARGADLRAFCDQLVRISQEGMEGLVLGDQRPGRASFMGACRATGLKNLVLWIELLLDAMHAAKQSPVARLPIDLAMAKFVLQASTPVMPVPVMSAVTSVPVVAPAPVKKEAPVEVVVVQQAEAEEIPPVHETVTVPVAVAIPQAINPEDWQKIIEELKRDTPSLVTSLAHAKLMGIEGDTLKIAVKYKMHADKLNQVKNRATIESIIESTLALPLKVTAEVVKDLAIEEEEESVDLASVFEFEE